eukprot:4606742-Amphidinium_carterae.2
MSWFISNQTVISCRSLLSEPVVSKRHVDSIHIIMIMVSSVLIVYLLCLFGKPWFGTAHVAALRVENVSLRYVLLLPRKLAQVNHAACRKVKEKVEACFGSTASASTELDVTQRLRSWARHCEVHRAVSAVETEVVTSRTGNLCDCRTEKGTHRNCTRRDRL